MLTLLCRAKADLAKYGVNSVTETIQLTKDVTSTTLGAVGISAKPAKPEDSFSLNPLANAVRGVAFK